MYAMAAVWVLSTVNLMESLFPKDGGVWAADPTADKPCHTVHSDLRQHHTVFTCEVYTYKAVGCEAYTCEALSCTNIPRFLYGN
jgi:hypothetical protein